MANKGGRPSLMDEAITRQLEQVFNGGSTVRDACAYVGISEATYYHWMKIGRAAHEGRARDKDHLYLPHKVEDRAPYLEFFERIKRARAVMRVEAIAIIRTAAQEGHWQAAAWLLERSDPDQWGRRVVTQEGRVDITSGGEPVQNATIEGMMSLFQQIGQREREQREKE